MGTIPVGRSIAGGYEFLFRRVVTVLALGWVAAVFYGALRYAVFAAGPLPQPLLGHPGLALIHLGGIVGTLLLTAAMAVPLTQRALGLGGEWAIAHFVLGRRELALFWGLVRVYLAIIAVAVVAALAVAGLAIAAKAGVAAWPAAANSGVPISLIVIAAASIAACVVTLYLALRLYFLLYPVAAAEGEFTLKRVWEITNRNVLRSLAVTLALMVPLAVVAFLADYAILGSPLIAAVRQTFGPAHDAAAIERLFAAHALPVSIVAALTLVAMTALNAGASAVAYRALTGNGPDLPEEAEPETAALPHETAAPMAEFLPVAQAVVAEYVAAGDEDAGHQELALEQETAAAEEAEAAHDADGAVADGSWAAPESEGETLIAAADDVPAAAPVEHTVGEADTDHDAPEPEHGQTADSAAAADGDALPASEAAHADAEAEAAVLDAETLELAEEVPAETSPKAGPIARAVMEEEKAAAEDEAPQTAHAPDDESPDGESHAAEKSSELEPA